ncbi:TetR/AcrR family transcriptional regulator [Blastococcus mobilis]|uniref:Transcriptional regulator, TetR family n=1 Tax=Blastococcus mobilis TaxID=1938746 RepID=A0A238USC4_9ACTN|nr:TetR/AcrR family transcriptional regulator [Blastococcus mobilis]SNR24567.1 transcriptional regulator, TetR family [Blastococcus mobilis]
MENVPGGARARHREQVRAEIQAHAWEQIAAAGPSAVSLRAIAKQMGMTAPALYRYFTSRDDLLSSLIRATHQELAEIVEATVSTDDLPEDRLRHIAAVFRRWATSHPDRYLLAHGTFLPGYAVPPEITTLTHRILTPALSAFLELEARHAAAAARTAALIGRRPDCDHCGRAQRASRALRRSVTFWTRLHGVLSRELAGHLGGIDVDAERLYEQETDSAIGRRLRVA